MNAPVTELNAPLRPARRTEQVKSSMIREILKVTQQPGMISLAGGLPAPETFPVEAMRAAFDAVLAHDGPGALQYSTTEGFARCANGSQQSRPRAARRRTPTRC